MMKPGDQQVGSLLQILTLSLLTLVHRFLGQMMQEIAQATFTYEQFPEVMGMLWKRMLGEKKNWRRTYKVIFHSLCCETEYVKGNVYLFLTVTFAAQLPGEKWL